jgi:anti-sigma B factor antagonist
MKPVGDERTPDGGEVAPQHPDREQLISLRVVDRSDAYIVVVRGAVDGLTATRLRDAIMRGLKARSGRPVVVDLSAVEFFGSAGLRTLWQAAAEDAETPGFTPLRLVVDHNRPVIRPMELVGLDKFLELYYDMPSAIAGGHERG